MKLATTTRPITNNQNIPEIIEFLNCIRESKFNHVNFSFHEIDELLDRDDIKDLFQPVEKTLVDFNIEVLVSHAPNLPFIKWNETREDEVNRLMNRIHHSIALSGNLHSKWIVLHLGAYLDESGIYDKKRSVQYNIDYLKKFIDVAIKNNIGLAIENHTNLDNLYPTIDELIEITDYFNKKYNREIVGICYDFGHANCASIDQSNAIKKIGKRLKVTHIHDNHGTDEHLLPLLGTIHWKPIMATLSEIKYDDNFTLEIDYKDNICLLHNNTFTNVELINKTYDVLQDLYKEML